jgi:hypothetical protein
MSTERIFWSATVLLLTLLLTLQGVSIRQESQTYDETVHLTAGYSYLITGDYRLNPEHPPLSKMLAAIPLLFLKPHLPVGPQLVERQCAPLRLHLSLPEPRSRRDPAAGGSMGHDSLHSLLRSGSGVVDTPPVWRRRRAARPVPLCV